MAAKAWTSIGTAASVNLFSAVPNLTEGTEFFGPLLLADDVEDPPEYQGFYAWQQRKPGLVIALDKEKVVHYRRAS